MDTTAIRNEKEIKKWQSIASTTALLFTATLVLAGGAGLWLTGQNRSMKNSNKSLIESSETMRKSNEMLSEELSNLNEKNKKNERLIEKLEKDVFDMTIKAASLTAELEVLKQANNPKTE